MKTAGVFIMPKIPEISVEVKWKIHFGFFWSKYLGLPSIGQPKFAFPFLTNRFTALLLLCEEFGKGIKLLESDSLWLARFGRKFLGYSHIWSTPRIINAILGHYACFWIFWRESFEARKQRLAARGSGSQARKIAFPAPIVLSSIYFVRPKYSCMYSRCEMLSCSQTWYKA